RRSRRARARFCRSG
ncbi:methyl-accepting chemotaxis protein, partial [Vibrio cholerae O1 str. AG-8040]